MEVTKRSQANPCPRLHANCLSKLTFWWLLDLFYYGSYHDLKASDLYDVLPENVSEPLGNHLEVSWEKELIDAQKKNRKPNLWNAIIRTFGWSFIRYGITMFTLHVIKILQPFVLALLIWYFDPLSTMTTNEAYMYATGLVLVTLLQTIIVRQAHLGQQEIGMRVKIACSSLVYRKVLKLSCTSASQAAGGLIINLLSTDLAKFESFVLHLQYTWIMPFATAMITYLIWRQLGIASVVGILCMAVQTIPTQVFWYTMTSRLRLKGAQKTDNRILLIGEILDGIRVIKMYVWEKYFEKLVYLARRYEMDLLLKRFYVRSVRLSFSVFTHRIALFCTILVYVLQGNPMVADKIFSTVHYFVLVRSIMARFFPEAVSLGAEVNVSIKRMQKFLLLEEVEPNIKPLETTDDNIISIQDVSASWEKNSAISNICDINIDFIPGKLYAVVGSVGSGKSSLLKLILGELPAAEGEVRLRGRVSYAGQEPWLFAGSLRDNVLFGEAYDEDRYRRVTAACDLNKDFERLPYGDRTLVGDRGATLSGGQCVRVGLARAVYREADIYLFDDPLSAVDTHVGKNLFQDCIVDLLKDKTRILVTHQVQYLREADRIILLNEGRVAFQGTFQSLHEDEEYLSFLPLEEETGNLSVEENSISKETRVIPDSISKLKKDDEKEPEETKELIAKGRVAKSLYLKLFRAGTSYFVLFILFLAFFLTQLVISVCDYWLAFWIKQEEKSLKFSANATNITNITSTETEEVATFLDTDTALIVYGSLILVIVILSNMRNLLFYKTVLNSSKNIHNSMFSRLVRAPMQFFHFNPSGRILNRFSKDTGAVDESLSNAMLEALERFFFTVGIFIQILIINLWTLIPILLVIYLSLKIIDIYLSTVQDIKRLEGNAKSPVFSLINSSLLGLPTIRSCRAEKIVRKEFDARQDKHTAAHYLILVTTSAFGFWLDVLAIGFLAFLTYNFIFFNDANTFAGDVGLALTQSLNVCGVLHFTMKQVVEVMAQMTSIERMFQFTELDQEEPQMTAPIHAPTKAWPSNGQVKFKNLYLRYADGDEPALKNLNLTIEPKMKVGIVGRTGAGKSSLISALFRLAETDGSLLIDGLDTRNLGLPDLRSKISIIPQEPMLFTASVRDNLDPFHQHEDAQLWSALREVELDRAFASLDQPIERGGGNLSAGQRQLICLARAIIGGNRILVLDEATANVDPATDDFIQRTIRDKFRDCTVLTIAHRLSTIIDSDRVLVMDNGEAVEFDHPHLLLKREDSYFSSLVEESGNAMAQHLRVIAEKAYTEENSKGDSSTSVPSDEESETTRL